MTRSLIALFTLSMSLFACAGAQPVALTPAPIATVGDQVALIAKTTADSVMDGLSRTGWSVSVTGNTRSAVSPTADETISVSAATGQVDSVAETVSTTYASTNWRCGKPVVALNGNAAVVTCHRNEVILEATVISAIADPAISTIIVSTRRLHLQRASLAADVMVDRMIARR